MTDPASPSPGLPFSTLFLQSPLAASVSRQSDGRLLAVNDAWVLLTGVSREQALQQTTVALGHWSSEADRQAYIRSLPEQREHDCESTVNGRSFRVRLHTSVLAHGDEPLLLVYLIDVNREQRAEAARSQSETALQQANRVLRERVELHTEIEKLARVGAWTVATNEHEVVWSPGLYEIAGLDLRPTISRIEGRGGIHPEDLPGWLAAREACDGREVEFRWLRPDGSIRWFRTRISRTVVAGQPETDFGVVLDVTAEREAAQALERQHRMLEAVRLAQAAFIEADDKRHAFERLLQALLAVTDSDYGFVGEVLYDQHGQPYLRTHAITNIAWDEATHRLYNEHIDKGLEFRNTRTLFGHALQTGEVVIANQPDRDHRAGGLPSGHPVMNAFLGIPLEAGGRLVAMVGLANQPGGYSPDDVAFLEPLTGAVRQMVLAWRGHVERKRARLQFQATSALLSEKSAALQVTLDSMGQGLMMIDASGHVRFYNHRMLELLHLPESLMSTHPRLDDVVHFQRERGDFGERLELVEHSVQAHVADPMQVNPPDRYLRRTRDGRTLEIASRMLPDGGMVRTYTDVSSYVQAQEALRDEQQRLQWVLEATRPGIWEISLETGEANINERWAEMLGYSVAELQPTNYATWRSLTHPNDLERVHRVLRWHRKGVLPYYEADLRMRHKDGHWVWINARGRVHRRDAQGKALYMSGTHLDIHERVAAQEQVRALNASLERRVAERTAALERSMKDMEAISYSIAHDLRAPLRSVNGFAALIQEEEGERMGAVGRDMFVRIERSSRYMGQMITDMLELLRVVRVELAPAPVDMNRQAHLVVEALAPALPHATIEVLPLPRVMGDATLLRQVLMNLMDNALKYSRHRSEPRLQLGHDKDRSAFYLRDNGMGFDMARANKLFGLFQRLHAGSDVPGTGVGLAIVARIIERHGGRIWAESTPDKGTTFWWSLPLV